MAKPSKKVNEALSELSGFYTRNFKKFLSDGDMDVRKFFSQAHDLDQMKHSEAWKILEAYWHYQREALLVEVEKAQDLENWNYYRGAMAGFKLASKMIDAILANADEIRQKQENEREHIHAEE